LSSPDRRAATAGAHPVAAPRGITAATARREAPRRAAAALPSSRKRGAEQTRQRIVASARRLFRERGFEQATTTDIAAAAGVAKGTLFLHARTKERLLVMVYEEEFRIANREAFAHPPQRVPIARALATILGHFFRVYEQDVRLARHFAREVQFLCRDDAADMCRVTDETIAGIASVIQTRKNHGEIEADVDPALGAANSFLLYYGILTAWLCGWLPAPQARDRALIDSLTLHWRGLERTRATPARRTQRRPAH